MKADMSIAFNMPLHRSLLALAVTLVLASCAADREHSQGMDLVKQGQPIKGLENLRHASELEPRNARFQADYLSKQQDIVRARLSTAEAQMEVGVWDDAARAYQEVLQVEPHNNAALNGLKALDAERRAEMQLASADKLMQTNKADQALEIARQILRELPRNARAERMRRAAEERVENDRQSREEQLAARAAFRRPVSLTFRDTPLKMIFEALSRAANINVVVDRDVKSDIKTTIFVKDAAIEDAIDVLLLQNQLEKRVLNGNTILVYPATAAKQKEFAELKVRSFQLSNIEAALMANILKTMIKTKDIVTDPKTNLLVMRDTAEAVALAERLVAANDVPEAEVMLEVNVLEVSATKASDLGVKMPSAFTLHRQPHADGSTTLSRSDFKDLLKGNVLVDAAGGSSLNLMMQDNDTQLLASPHIRTRSKEKAKILVGDKLPQITNVLSANAGATGAANAFTPLTGSIQYIDVGIKLEVEPEVYTDGDVGIKLNLEVSNVTGTTTTQSGTAYQIGTRSAQTSLRLHDGETQVLGGLIRDSDSDAAQRIPGLGQMPVLGHLFSDHKIDGAKTEIIVTITPRIIRPRATPDLRFTDAWSGSDTTIRDRPLRLDSIGSLKVGPVRTEAMPAPAPLAIPAPRAVAPALPSPLPGVSRAPEAKPAASPPTQTPTAAPRFSPPALREPAPAPTADTTDGGAGDTPAVEPKP